MKNEGSFEPTLLLGHMTYADRLMKTVIPIEEIGNRYGENHSMIHTCVDAIITTTDHKIVYGVKKMSTDLKPGKIGYISGNMNADEVRVSIFEDIYRMMSKEISEEANIKPERERLSFIKLGLSNGWASFYFLYRLGISSTELNKIEKDDEFDHFESAYPQEIARMVRIATSDFNFSKGFIENLKL